LLLRGLSKFKRISSDVGKLDYFISLVVMAKNDGSISEGLSGFSRTGQKLWITRLWNVPGAGNPSLREWIGKRAK
jgi:hypothetical protein